MRLAPAAQLARQIARARGGDVYVGEAGGPPLTPEIPDRTGTFGPDTEPVTGGAVFVARLHDAMEIDK
ncbi:hypothetical protein GTY65_37960 [Streptomyces sp. SID8379]|uniref:hypothetical protein n=1 Tax=unclassified Streptomyces TaxID=2593676 RepID=UPI00036B7A93|nr:MULTISPECIES: hypothetical protein [unclassified Streptomyces]MYW69803.1 hypothetical protein [Streptomyces sp. SID8379]